MWRALIFLLVFNYVLVATQNQSHSDRLRLRSLSNVEEDVIDETDRNDNDYDYGDNNESSDNVYVSAPAHRNYHLRNLPSNPTPSSASSSILTSSELQHKRVPRHPQHLQLQHNNRLDGDSAAAAAFDETDQAFGELTAQKEKEVGTSEKVQSSLRRYQASTYSYSQLREMALEHKKRMDTEARCRWPQPRVIPVDNETSKTYSPRVTTLHRCDEFTGCCEESMVCAVKTKEIVEKAFWVGSTDNIQFKPQLISLTNHTECECVYLSTQRRKRSSQCLCPRHFNNFTNFHSRQRSATSCRCDCHLSNATCQRLKNGEEGFAMSERRCIMRNECSPPICNYGSYNTHRGRCPRPLQQQQQQQQRQLGFG